MQYEFSLLVSLCNVVWDQPPFLVYIIFYVMQSLQGKNNASDIPGILGQMFKVIPNGNPYEEVYNRPCRTCAVVGNSGNLKGSRHGKKIDSHKLIIR